MSFLLAQMKELKKTSTPPRPHLLQLTRPSLGMYERVPTPHQTSPHMVRGLTEELQRPLILRPFWYRGTRDEFLDGWRGESFFDKCLQDSKE